MSTRRHISTNSWLEREYGFCRAVVQDPFVFVSGTAGFDYTTMEISDDPVEQAHAAWETIAAALTQADSDMSEIVKTTIYLLDSIDADPVLHACARVLERVRPASSVVIVNGFGHPDIKVLIEATAMWRVSAGEPE
jgi:enamine deaminase RidA (YjgF/YER057c/UK114 family)